MCDYPEFEITKDLEILINNEGQFNIVFSDLQNMFQKLYEWKIDFQNLIGRGLAIEVTETFNPYL